MAELHMADSFVTVPQGFSELVSRRLSLTRAQGFDAHTLAALWAQLGDDFAAIGYMQNAQLCFDKAVNYGWRPPEIPEIQGA